MRKYKAVIEIVCEAENANEALDVAGEYLRGALATGVRMRHWARPLRSAAKVVVTLGMMLAVIGGILSTNFTHPQQYSGSDLLGFNACQVPLKTHITGIERAEFKNSWKQMGTGKSLEQIKK